MAQAQRKPASDADTEATATGGSASELEGRLFDLKARLAALDAQEPELAHAVATGQDGAQERHAELLSARSGVRAQVLLLTSAIAHAKQREGQAEAAKIAKRQAQHKARVDAKMTELREVVADFQAKLAAAITAQRHWHQLAAELAVAWPWGHGPQNAAGFHPDEVTRATMHEIARLGSGQLLLGGVRRPSFPGALSPSIDLLHRPEAIPPLIDRINEQHGFAIRILNGEKP